MDIFTEAENLLFKIYSLTNQNPGEYVSYNNIKEKWLNDSQKDEEVKKLSFMLDDILTNSKKYLEKKNIGEVRYKITPTGFECIHNILTQRRETNIAFCAMWFDPSTDQTWENGIKPAIEESGFEPQRIDQVPFNHDINSMMITMINKCKFVVADFTGDRGGVYFEAGYAHGLKIPVIYTCSDDSWGKNKPHFDVEHYNFILWNSDNLNKFKDRLRDRIINTIF